MRMENANIYKEIVKDNFSDTLKIGIYTITNIITNQIYVGSTTRLKTGPKQNHYGFRDRYRIHINKLNNNKHFNKHLQSSWNKYGYSNFEFKILDIISIQSIIIENEQYWCNILNVFNSEYGFNKTQPMYSNIWNYNKKVKESTKRKVSNKLKGRKRPLSVFKSLVKPVSQYSKEGIFINSYYGLSEAERQTTISRCSIRDVANEKPGNYTAGGFKWKWGNNN